MKGFFSNLFIIIMLASCTKDVAVQPENNSVCGTVGWPQVNCKVKFVVTGNSMPDSVNFNINMGKAQSGTVYYRTFATPGLTLMDSTNFCGNKNSDVNLIVYNNDSTKNYTTKIYINDSLIIQETGRNPFTVAQCK